MDRLAIIGGGDLGQQIAYYAVSDKKFNFVGFFEDYRYDSNLGKADNIKILGKISEVEQVYNRGEFDCLLVAIGYKHLDFRKEVFNRYKETIPFATFIHSSVHLESNVVIKRGAVIYPRCLLDSNVVIEENVLLNVQCTISHDSIINSHSFLSPRVAVAGFCEIGEQNIIGINSTVIDNIKTPSKIRTGGGTVVINNPEKPGLYAGNPARFIK